MSQAARILIVLALATSVLAASAAGCALPPGSMPAQLNNRGNRAFQQGDYPSALRDYLLAQADLSERPEPGYNAANTLYRMGDFQGAQQRLLGSLNGSDPQLAQAAAYNLGNTFFRQGLYAQAADQYRQALRLNPQDIDAKHNLELALRELADQPQPPTGAAPPPESQSETPAVEPTSASNPGARTPGASTPGARTPEPPTTLQPLTAEQARALLDQVGQMSQSLQQYLGRQVFATGLPAQKDW